MKKLFLSFGAFSFVALAAVFLAYPKSAYAATECQVTLASYGVGDGDLILTYTNGGNSSIASSSAGYKDVLATVIASIVSNKRVVTVRYSGNGISCTATGQTLAFLWVTPQSPQ